MKTTKIRCPLCMSTMTEVFLKRLKKPEVEPNIYLLRDATTARTFTHHAIGKCDFHGVQSTKIVGYPHDHHRQVGQGARSA